MTRSLSAFIFLSLAALPFSLGAATGVAAAEGHGAASVQEGSGLFENGPIYVNLSPLVVPIVREDGVEQIVSLLLTVHVKSTEASMLLQKNLPRITDALYSRLYGSLEATSGFEYRSKKLNIETIKSKAVDAVSSVIGRENVVDVLIRGLTQRML
ncbi:MAG: hypothetical protein PHS57_00155 [Alphaproteobacteria bacterium]|nr:hypothetical protein [Alphaproteobacteria bacterium]